MSGEAGAAPAPSAAFLLITLGRRAAARVDAELAPHEISMRHVSALGHLSRQPGLSYSELARRAGISPQSMQATLGRLETLGAVERLTDAGRGRTAELTVTPFGQELIARGRAAVDHADENLFAGVPEPDREHLTSTLLRIFLESDRR